MTKNNSFTKIKKFILILLTGISFTFLYSCSNTNNQEVVSSDKVDIKTTEIIKKEITKAKREAPNWLNILPEIEFADIERNENNYSYKYKPEKTNNGEINRLLTYTKNSDEEFLGSMNLKFSNTEKTYIETIPKTFAKHVNDLDFSLQPSKIINPDPIVEFTNIKGELEINAKKTVSSEEIEKTIQSQLLNREFARCEDLEGIDSYNCALKLVAKYRGTEALEKELSDVNIDLTTIFGASINAVEKQGFRKCKLVKSEEGQSLCYEYAYQVLVAECNSQTGKDYRTCVRRISLQLPNQEVRRLFCHYIDDEQMYNECRGKAKMSVCDEIENEDQKMICQINIAKTEGDIDSCNKIENTDAQDICRAMMGMDQNNEKYCNLVKDEYYKGECLIKIALRNDNGEICDKITHKTQKDMCLSHFMIKKDGINQQMCDGFNDEFMKELCNLLLIVQENDAEKCETIISSYNKNFCYLAIAGKTKDRELCNKITFPEVKAECIKALEEPEIQLPQIPDWMSCPIPDGAEPRITNNEYTSGLIYLNPDNNNKRSGPSLSYTGPDFEQPYLLMCYNTNGEKHGPFKSYTQDKGNIRKEGHYKNNKLDQEVREYTNGVLRSIWTYKNGKQNGPASYYCTVDACSKGPIMSEGPLVNDRKHGMWTFYKHGEFDYKSEYVNGFVTRDESGKNIKYR